MNEISSKKWVVGDRIGTNEDKELGTLGTVTSVNKKIIIIWKNGLSAEYTPKQIQSYGYKKFLEERAIAVCNSNTPASLQESGGLTSELMPPEHLISLKPDSSSKITPPLNEFSATDSQKLQSTAISLTITPSQENLTSTQLDFLAPVLALPETERDLITQNQNSGLNPCAALPMVAPVSSSSKILQGLSPEDYEQFLGDSEWLAISGMIRKSYQLRNLDRPKKEKGFLSLPTPTTYAKGSTGCRPAGATRLEQKLRPYITKGDKLNPAVPGWMMGFPVGWVEWPLMDTGETISVQLPFIQEYAATSINGENVTTCTPVQFAPSRLRSLSVESVTSLTLHQVKQSDVELNLYICNSFLNIGKITEVWQTCFTVNWSSEIKCYFWERDDEVIRELAIAPQHLIDKFLEDEPNFATSERIPENFLEETERAAAFTKKPKGRQRKGCLYKYLENKKLKSGDIASYPRVIGRRNPDNPTHWRWGFNWEEKVDGEWKGRSIGSVPLGAIALIQSMQNEGISLEEIIGFIRRAKSKKC